MLGFIAVISLKGKIKQKVFDACFDSVETQSKKEKYIAETIRTDRCFIYRHMLNKFQNDNAFYEKNGTAVCVEEVLLNGGELLSKYKSSTVNELFYKLAEDGGLEDVLKEARGAFSGVIVDKEQVIAFVDHFAVKQLFYTVQDDVIVVASEVNEIVHLMKSCGWEYHLDLVGAYSLLTYAYMYKDHTLISEIKRIKEGSILEFGIDRIKKKVYHALSNKPIKIGTEDAIEEIDRLFTDSVKLQLDKNKEYGYENVVPLSAGLDCRMTSFVAKELLRRPFLNFTYSEFGQQDCLVSGEMAHAQGNRWIFKSLDNGWDLFNIEKSVTLSDGLIYYMWPAQLNDFLEFMNTDKWGIVHTGVLGDGVLGSSYCKIDENCKAQQYGQYKIGDGGYSMRLIPKLKEILGDVALGSSSDYELGLYENRAINGICMGYSTSFRQYAIDLSPFMNVDFADFCMSLPVADRERHAIYYKWVLEKHPKAARFKHNGVKIDGNKKIHYHGHDVAIVQMPDIMIKKFRKRFVKNYSMNPLEYWLDTNPAIKKIWDRYFDKYIDVLSEWLELQHDTVDLYKTGNVTEKSQALSLIGSVKMFFN